MSAFGGLVFCRRQKTNICLDYQSLDGVLVSPKPAWEAAGKQLGSPPMHSFVVATYPSTVVGLTHRR
jgi:hypothetical protein